MILYLHDLTMHHIFLFIVVQENTKIRHYLTMHVQIWKPRPPYNIFHNIVCFGSEPLNKWSSNFHIITSAYCTVTLISREFSCKVNVKRIYHNTSRGITVTGKKSKHIVLTIVTSLKIQKVTDTSGMHKTENISY
jgi:hypothetical protein